MQRSPLALLALTALMHACGPSHTHADGSQRRIFIHGDPKHLLDGYDLSQNTALTPEGLAKFEGFGLVNYEVTTQREAVPDEDPHQPVNVEQGEEAAVSRRNEGTPTYTLKASGDIYRYLPTDAGGDSFGQLKFKKVGGELVLQKAGNLSVQLVHYSVKEGGEAFSLLWQGTNASDGHFLAAAYFTKIHADAAPLADVSRDFHYLMGAGIVNVWPGAPGSDLHIDLCGVMSAEEEEQIRTAIGSWVKGGRIGQRSLSISRKTAAPAFSDLNIHCLSLVDDYLFENSDRYTEDGLTVTTLDTRRQQILGAHIFLSRLAFKNLKVTADSDSFKRTAAHEFGHFLGLDHEFTKAADGQAKFPSIMSYDSQVVKVTDHDLAAVEPLYGAYPH